MYHISASQAKEKKQRKEKSKERERRGQQWPNSVHVGVTRSAGADTVSNSNMQLEFSSGEVGNDLPRDRECYVKQPVKIIKKLLVKEVPVQLLQLNDRRVSVKQRK